jgi:dipeptidyl aminopeptidase/acylaminoacyl peptidase
MYERRTAKNPSDMSKLEWRDAVAQWVREIRQSMNYLASRDDIDINRVAYYGSSYGAMIAPGILVLEPRFRTAILRHGGFWLGDEHPLPECDAVTFAPHVKIPVLMMNGRYDPIFPPETSQRPFFDMLGSPAGAKRYVLFDVGHDFPPRNEMIRETLDWLDTYLGEVR